MTDVFLVYDSYESDGRDYMVLACFREEDRKLLYIRYFDKSRHSRVGDVYVARVEKKVPHVGVFLVIPDGAHVFVKEKNADNPFYVKRLSQKKDLSEGDFVLVQIEKDAIKTKEMEAAFSVSVKTPYFILTEPGSGVHFSKKLKEEKKKELAGIYAENASILVRTAASSLTASFLQDKINSSLEKINGIFSSGKNHTGPALVYENDDTLNSILTAFPFAANDLKVTEIKTSDPLICKKLGDCGSLYKDDGLSLLDLYRIRTITDELRKKTVWLKSGSNIVIEQTEALTVIDVNSAKAKKSTAYSVNEETAYAIMEQIRLRNISGIIVIDFMKMKNEEEREQIIKKMKQLGKRDFARVSVEDFTKLGLLEMTREKLFPSVNQTLTAGINYDTISSVDAQ